MRNNQLQIKEALNKVFLRVKPTPQAIADFQANLGALLVRCEAKQSEEFHKNLLRDFLLKIDYSDRHFINTKENSDLVIHNGKGSDSTVGVIFETKKPTKKPSAEMPRIDDLNRNALQQLVLYFLRERVIHNNLAVKHLVITNIHEWFVFDAKIFEDLFFNDKALVKNFQDFEAGRLSGKTTDFFYKQIAEPAIATKAPLTYSYKNI